MTGEDWALVGAGLRVTVELSVASIAASLVLGTAIGVMRTLPSLVLRALAAGYIEYFRNVPLLIVLFFAFNGLPHSGLRLEPWTAAFLGLSLFHAASVAEIVRAGLEAVPRGQLEAARALGLTRAQALWYVLLPQTMRAVVPPLGNIGIALVKNTSVAGTISVFDLVKQADVIESRTFDPTVFVLAGLMYGVVLGPLALAVNALEARLRLPGHARR